MENKVEFDLEENQPLKYLSKVIGDSSLSFEQKKLYKNVLASYQKALFYRDGRSKKIMKYENLAFSFVSSQHYPKDIEPLLNKTVDHNYDFATFFSIVKSNLASSELGAYISDFEQEDFDIQKCFLDYKKDHDKPSNRVMLGVNLYQLILQILRDDYKEAGRIKNFLFDIMPVEDNYDSEMLCLNFYSQLRLLYKEEVLDDTLYGILTRLVQYYMVYSRNNDHISLAVQQEKMGNTK